MKRYSTVGCCGIDCGLCPRYHTKGSSACPGCGGLNFKLKHPACGTLTCCAIRNSLDVCVDCKDYPCNKFKHENVSYDTFVTHKKMFDNLRFIKDNGIELFLLQQIKRITILGSLLADFDDGRSKSYYCISCTLLPLFELENASNKLEKIKVLTIKKKIKLIREEFDLIAKNNGIELKLNKKL